MGKSKILVATERKSHTFFLYVLIGLVPAVKYCSGMSHLYEQRGNMKFERSGRLSWCGVYSKTLTIFQVMCLKDLRSNVAKAEGNNKGVCRACIITGKLLAAL